jgi:hypothetical protein
MMAPVVRLYPEESLNSLTTGPGRPDQGRVALALLRHADLAPQAAGEAVLKDRMSRHQKRFN